MDIKPVSSHTDLSLRASPQAQIEPVSALAKSLGLKTGGQFLGQVTQVSRPTTEERAEIIKSLDSALAGLDKHSAAPAVKGIEAQLLEQKQLAQQAQLKLIHLNLSNPLQKAAPTTSDSQPTPQSLLSYTTHAVTVGQTLLLQLAAHQRVQILEPLTPDQLNKVLNLITTLTQEGKPLPDSLGKLLQAVGDTTSTQARVQAQEAISNSLRQLLPLKDSGQDLLGSLPKVMQFLQQLSPSVRSEWLSADVQTSLKALANHIRLSDQLSNPKLLAMALKTNGQGFELGLAQRLGLSLPTAIGTSPLSSAGLTGAKASGSPAGIPAASGMAIKESLKSQGTAALANLPATPPLSKLAAQDLKGALLGVLHQLERESATLTASGILPPMTDKFSPNNALPQFLGLLLLRPPAELSQKQLRAQLVMLMHQYTLGSLAKIQLQQIHSVSQQLNQADQAQPLPSWQFELPIRHGQEVHPLHIQLEQKWIEDPEEKDTGTSRRLRQWNIMLGFDLPQLGHFYAHLGLLGEQLTIRFWAEREPTLQAARAKLDSLRTQFEQEGIEVVQLQCVPGLPPSQKMSIHYALVDVKT